MNLKIRSGSRKSLILLQIIKIVSYLNSWETRNNSSDRNQSFMILVSSEQKMRKGK